MKRFEFTDEEYAALCDFFPTLMIANVATSDTPLASALYKLCPHKMTRTLRRREADRARRAAQDA